VKAVRSFRTQAAFAAITTKTQQGVSKRLAARQLLWAEDVLAVEAATGISRYELRPDIFQHDTTLGAQATKTSLEPVQ